MFRILALDGGGIKGVFTAAALSALEDESGQRIIDHFDLIAGTSTGGIIAIGIALGFSGRELLDFYTHRGSTIFPHTSLTARTNATLRWVFAPKHSHNILKLELTNVLGTRKFGDAKTRLIIPTYDAVAGRIYVMKTRHHPRFKYDAQASAVDVALATSAAPTYFSAAPFPTHQNASYVDGGVWANSPALVAVVEALSFLGKHSSEIDVLSIGTTATPFNVAKRGRAGLLGWNNGLLDLALTAQAEAALAQASLLAEGRLLRIDRITTAGQFSLDDSRAETISQLANLGRGEAVKKATLDAVIQRFLNGKKAEQCIPFA